MPDPRFIENNYPFQSHLGFELKEWREDYAMIEAVIEAFMSNRQGLPHGGVHATLLDSAMGFAGCYTGDAYQRRMALTLSMTVNFVDQAQGRRLRAEGWRTGGGRRTYFAEGAVRDELGTLVATATGVFRYRSRG
jgi:uncharacterized protein (TIGR00369 family)